MTRWSHSKKQVRDALNDAYAAGLEVVDTSAHGHSWGYVQCTVDKQRMSVWSTPKNGDNHAKQIRKFVSRHCHPDQEGGPDEQL